MASLQVENPKPCLGGSSIPLRLTPFPKCQKARVAYSGDNAGKATPPSRRVTSPMDKLTQRY